MASSDFVIRARRLVDDGQFQEAVKICRLGLLAEPKHLEGRLVLGAALISLGRHDEVLAEMRVALEVAPESETALALKGEALLRKGEAAQATEVLEAARALAPGSEDIRSLYQEAAVAAASGGAAADIPPEIEEPLSEFEADHSTRHYPAPHAAGGPDRAADEPFAGEATEMAHAPPAFADDPRFGPADYDDALGADDLTGDDTSDAWEDVPLSPFETGEWYRAVRDSPEAAAHLFSKDNQAKVGRGGPVGEGEAEDRGSAAARAGATGLGPTGDSAAGDRGLAGASERSGVGGSSTAEAGRGGAQGAPNVPAPGGEGAGRPPPPPGQRGAPPGPAGAGPGGEGAGRPPPPPGQRGAPPGPAGAPSGAGTELGSTTGSGLGSGQAVGSGAGSTSGPASEGDPGLPRGPEVAGGQSSASGRSPPPSEADMELIRASLGMAPGGSDPAGAAVAGGEVRPDPTMSVRRDREAARGRRRRRGIIAVVYAIATAAAIGGGVGAGLAIRDYRLADQVEHARALAEDRAAHGSFAGLREASQLYGDIRAVADDRELEAAHARARALLAYVHGYEVEAGQEAAEEVVGSELADAAVARAFDALLAGSPRDARARAEAADPAWRAFIEGESLLLDGRPEDAAAAFARAAGEGEDDDEAAALGRVREAAAARRAGDVNAAAEALERAAVAAREIPYAFPAVEIEEARLFARAAGRSPRAHRARASEAGAASEADAGAEAGADGDADVEAEDGAAEAASIAGEEFEPAARAEELAELASEGELSPREELSATVARAELLEAAGDREGALAVLPGITVPDEGWGALLAEDALALALGLEEDLEDGERDPEAARAIARAAAEAFPERAAAHLALARAALAAFDLGAIDELLRDLDRFAEPGRLRALTLRGRAARLGGDLEAAREDLEAALALAGDEPEGALLPTLELALLDRAEGEPEAARDRLQPYGDEEGWENARVAAAAAGAAAEMGDARQARTILSRLGAADDIEAAGAEVALEWARFHRDRIEYEPARDGYLRALDVAPERVDWRREVASFFLDFGRPGEAAELFDEVAEAQPERAEAWVSAARAHALAAGLEEAAERLDRAEEAPEPPAGAIARERGRILLREGESEAAAEALEEAVEVEVRDDEAWILLMRARTGAGEEDGVREVVESIVRHLGDHPAAELARGRHHAFRGRQDEALEAFRRAAAELAEAPPRRRAEPYFGLGRVLYEMGELEDAAAALDTAVELDPGRALAHILLGNVRFELDALGPAARAYEAAVEVEPEAHPDAWFYLAEAAEGDGDGERAAEALERYLELAPEGDFAGDAEDMLADLGI